MKSKIKYTFLSMLLAVFVAQPVLASPLNNDDIAFAFGKPSAVYSDQGEFALLSNREMRETEGEFWPVIAAFGFLGGYSGGGCHIWLTLRIQHGQEDCLLLAGVLLVEQQVQLVDQVGGC